MMMTEEFPFDEALPCPKKAPLTIQVFRTIGTSPEQVPWSQSTPSYLWNLGTNLEEVRSYCSLGDRAMKLNESHRKSMLRTLLGLDDLNEQIRSLRLEMAWERAILFVKDHLLSWGTEPLGLQHYPSPQQRFHSPSKWFSYLARGREYKGVLERLLQTRRPDIVGAYLKATKPIDDEEVIELLIQNSYSTYKAEASTCLTMDLPLPFLPPPQGAAQGKQTENDLYLFLESRVENSSLTASSSRRTVLQNITVKPKADGKECGPVLLGDVQDRATCEFDCIVVEYTSETTLSIQEVWEAKATVNPATVYNTFAKKADSLRSILSNNKSAMVINGHRFVVDSTVVPRVGLFGSSLASPTKAASQMFTVISHRRISRDVSTVVDALKSKTVLVASEEVERSLDELKDVVESVGTGYSFVLVPHHGNQ